MTIDIPQPYIVGAFGILLGAIVGAVVARRRKDAQDVEDATEIMGTGERPSVEMARGIVGANKTLLRANEALQICNKGLEGELSVVQAKLTTAEKTLTEALTRIGSLESAIREMTRIRDNKSERVGDANRDLV